ncbi:hypothetical protein [Nocardioides sp. cx-173]|uniref:hypothetical protein n=1 Tax=Nocardioides sp. cx-173 TaxID=2898796 RepID=UPI001E5EB7C2|nr:hypothetical protein [Nocardioides sp. cx-173]MCD4526421.1 hypothetical protein [Nocardioides sp. cx-173]UGB41111.1 hypothetical protein LQ940_17280 [Nocardioides sp. cx-173]
MNLVPLHLGALHPVEQALTIALAFGPFVVLGIVIAVRRRQEAAEDAASEDGAAEDEAEGQRER